MLTVESMEQAAFCGCYLQCFLLFLLVFCDVCVVDYFYARQMTL